MCNNADDVIQNRFAAEFTNVVFDVCSDNGQINQKSLMLTVFVDGDIEKYHDEIITFAKEVFDEIFTDGGNDGKSEFYFYGLLIDKGE
jgi:putative NADPH-quinone reductase